MFQLPIFSSLYAKLQYVLNELNDKDAASEVERSSKEDEKVIMRNLQEQIQLNKEVCKNLNKPILFEVFQYSKWNLLLSSWHIH